jgi:hypothetical protein
VSLERSSIALTNLEENSQVPVCQTITKRGPFENKAGQVRLPDRIPSGLFGSSFVFLVNGGMIESDIAEAVALSPFVREQLSVDCCAHEFVICDNDIDSSSIASLQSLLSGSVISVGCSEGLLSKDLGNWSLECLPFLCSKSGIYGTVSGSKISKGVDFELADISVLSFEALDDLLLNSSFMIESEDALLRHFLKFESCDWFLVEHIQLEFLSDEGLWLLADHFKIPPESVWEWAIEAITHPPPSQLDSVIVSSFPAIFAEFRDKHFTFLWRGGRDGFKASDFHRRCDGPANTLTPTLDTNGTIFGVVTLVGWESRMWNGKWEDEDNCSKADDSQKSVLFTLKNPPNVAARELR